MLQHNVKNYLSQILASRLFSPPSFGCKLGLYRSNAFEETIDISESVVKIKTGAGAGGDTQMCMQRLGAVVTSTNRHAKLIVEYLGKFMGMDFFKGKTNKRRTMFRCRA